MARNTENGGKWEIHSVGTGIWWENWKTWKMRHKHCLTWNMARNNEKVREWEMHSLGPGIWREKYHEYHGKWETHTVGCEMRWETLANLKNGKNTLGPR